jgi:hypothetical protein
MRETVKEWKDEWIETNGDTNELEVVITDSNLDNLAPYIYEGSFANIPVVLEEKKVIHNGKILDSSVPARIGAYSLTI